MLISRGAGQWLDSLQSDTSICSVDDGWMRDRQNFENSLKGFFCFCCSIRHWSIAGRILCVKAVCNAPVPSNP